MARAVGLSPSMNATCGEEEHFAEPQGEPAGGFQHSESLKGRVEEMELIIPITLIFHIKKQVHVNVHKSQNRRTGKHFTQA